MSAGVNGLARLHDFHFQLRQVLDQLDRGPRQIKIRHQAVQLKQGELEAHREKLTALRVKADQGNLQVKTNEAKIDNLRGKLNSASSNREFDAFRSQIDADTMSNSVLEDEVLEQLEKIDLFKAAQEKLEAELQKLKAEEARVTAEVAAGEPALRAKASALEGEIVTAEVVIPEEKKPVYRRLVLAYSAAAFSEVDENATCTTCYVQIPTQMVMEIKGGKVMCCRTCGRLLFVKPKGS